MFAVINRRKRALDELELRRGQSRTYTEPLVVTDKEFLRNFYKRIYENGTRNLHQAELSKYPDSLGTHYNVLVPDTVSYEDFWQRYEYRCNLERIMNELTEQDSEAQKKSMQDSINSVKTFWSSVKGESPVSPKKIAVVNSNTTNSETVPQLPFPEVEATPPAKAKPLPDNSDGATQPVTPYTPNTAHATLRRFQNLWKNQDDDDVAVQQTATGPELAQASGSVSQGNDKLNNKPNTMVSNDEKQSIQDTKEKETTSHEEKGQAIKSPISFMWWTLPLLLILILTFALQMFAPLAQPALCGPIQPWTTLTLSSLSSQHRAPWWLPSGEHSFVWESLCSNQMPTTLEWRINNKKDAAKLIVRCVDDNAVLLEERGLEYVKVEWDRLILGRKNKIDEVAIPWSSKKK